MSQPDTKFALLVGINYRGTRSALRGCINDVHTMKEHLLTKRGYDAKNIIVLTEDENKKPTSANILHELSLLILKSHTHNAQELWFHYSGHGSRTRDLNGDEDDGFDETLVPLDYSTSGMITDDKIHDYLEHLPSTCKMYCIMDCCHSGTILDLKYQYKGNGKNGVENVASKLKGNIVMISGCRDIETSADARITGKWCGAMTTSYVNCIKDDISCEDLLEAMRTYLSKSKYTQYPQLCSSEPITNARPW